MIIGDRLGIEVKESKESQKIKTLIATILQRSLNMASMEVFGVEKLVSIQLLQEALSHHRVATLIRKIVTDKKEELQAISVFCEDIIERAKSELAEEYCDPVCTYAMYLIRKATLKVLDMLKAEENSCSVKNLVGEVTNSLKKKWGKENFRKSFQAETHLAQTLLTHHVKILDDGLLDENPLYGVLRNLTTLKRVETSLAEELGSEALRCVGVNQGTKMKRDLSVWEFLPMDRGDLDVIEYMDVQVRCLVFLSYCKTLFIREDFIFA